VRHERLDQSQAEATASAGDDGALIFEARKFCALCLGAATTIELQKRSQCASGPWPKAPSGTLRSFCRLQDRFNKSLSMSDEVSSLAGDRVVSHERSRPADLSRRDRLCSRNAGSYPSHYCGCVSRCALLAYGHRCRATLTRRQRSHAPGVNFESDRSLTGPPRNDTIRLGETPSSDCFRAFRW
jgi:hypothetical protein